MWLHRSPSDAVDAGLHSAVKRLRLYVLSMTRQNVGQSMHALNLICKKDKRLKLKMSTRRESEDHYEDAVCDPINGTELPRETGREAAISF
jgi:hypothetical protein